MVLIARLGSYSWGRLVFRENNLHTDYFVSNKLQTIN